MRTLLLFYDAVFLLTLYISLSCTYSMSLLRQYKRRAQTNRLIPEYWRPHYDNYMEHMAENDALDDYINEWDQYYTDYYQTLGMGKLSFKKQTPHTPMDPQQILEGWDTAAGSNAMP
eukprot:305549_1